MARLFIVLGVLFLAIGLLWPLLVRLHLGHLPGDIAYRRGNFAFYFPIVTSLLVSLALTVLLSLVSLLLRRR